MLTDNIKVKRYIGHNSCEVSLSIKDGLITFIPKEFLWESLRFQFLIKDLSSIKLYDVFTVKSYTKEYLSSKALNLKTKTGAQYIIGNPNIESLLTFFKMS
ncbi:hypothetical protein [Clostridium massiliamazoniense]|uniref:hypothetical protein n=1 Tax=Clostridium massiliamazoniense TaxID=1347366 RepID=UPI0006D7E2E6|nr:hypothetical protein [Clostridium massiliamazoniense]